MDVFSGTFGLGLGANSDGFGVSLGISLLALHLFGWGYCYLIYVFLPKRRIKHKTAEWVVIGVMATLVGYGSALGWDARVTITGFEAFGLAFLCFVATGLPMVLGYWFIDSRNEAEDEAEAKKIFDAMRERGTNGEEKK